FLNAGMPAESAQALAKAISDSEEFEGDYQAFLDAVATPEGREALSSMIQDVNELDGKGAEAYIDAIVSGKEETDSLKGNLDDIQGRGTIFSTVNVVREGVSNSALRGLSTVAQARDDTFTATFNSEGATQVESNAGSAA